MRRPSFQMGGMVLEMLWFGIYSLTQGLGSTQSLLQLLFLHHEK